MATPPEPPDMPGLRPMEEAANKIMRAADSMQDANRKLNSQLADLSKTLGKLSDNLAKGKGSKSGSGSTTRQGHSYGGNGGVPTFGGWPHGQGSQGQPTGQPLPHPGQPTPNGGGGLFSGLTYGKTPAPGAPGHIGRFAAAFAGSTPKAWGTQYNPTEMSAQLLHQGIDIAAQRGAAQLDDHVLMQRLGIEARQTGLSRAEYESLFVRGVLGTRLQTPGSVQEANRVGEGAYLNAQSTLDATRGFETAMRFSGGLGTERGRQRFQRTMETQALFGYTNPTASMEQVTKAATSLIQPSRRLHLMMSGLPDPVGPDGTYRGNARFFEAFLKRMYQKPHTTPKEFEEDFREGGIGWINLVNLFGEEVADLMLPGLRAYNNAKAMGKDVSDFDTTFAKAAKTGTEGDAARKHAREKYNVGLENESLQHEQMNRARSRASELSGTEEYVRAQHTASSAMQIFADAVHMFVNSPLIGELANFIKGVGPYVGQVADFGGAGALNILGMAGLRGQGPSTDSGSGAAPITSGSLNVPPPPSGQDMEKTARKSDNIGAEIAQRAASYATGSRKYKYSMRYRDRDGYFDCSSFVSRVYKQFGYTIGPTTVQMWKQGEAVDLSDVQPGDLLLWARGTPGAQSGSAEHVEMYIGNGKTVGTSSRGKNGNTIQIQPFRAGEWDAARRIVGASKRGKPKKDKSQPSPESEDPGLLGKLKEGVSDFVGGVSKLFGGGGADTAGVSSAVGGLGSASAAAYSTNSLDALAAFLSPGGGGGFFGGGSGEGEPDTGDGDAETPPPGSKSTEQEPDGNDGDSNGGIDPSKIKVGKTRKDKSAVRRSQDMIAWSKREGFGDSPWTQNFAPEKHPKANAEANKAIAKKLLKARGWGKHWRALESLWTMESSWNQFADNPSSDAYGIPQALPPWKMKSAGDDWRTNPATQIKWGLDYIKERYGTPTAAWQHWGKHKSYDRGAWQLPDDQVALVHKDEMIIPPSQARMIRDVLVESNIGGRLNRADEDSGMPDRQPAVQLNFHEGSIVFQTGKNVSEAAGRAHALGFVKELERTQLYQSIQQGRREMRNGSRSRR